MNIKSVVVHEIKKVEKTTVAEITLTDKALDHTDAKIIDMVTKLDESFGKKTLKRAKFSDDGFKKVIPDFSAIDLLEKSKELTTNLKANIQNIPAAKGGYLLFCEYASTKKFLAVYLIRDTKSPLFKLKDDNSWDVVDSQHLDIDHFAMGAKINLDILNSDSEDRYVALIKGNTDVSGYFENWVGIDDTKQETKDADALYDISNKIELPKGVATRDDLKRKIHDFVKSQPSRSLNLRALSKHLYDNEDTITKYCDNNAIDIDGEFKLSAAQLRKFYKLVVTAGEIELRAPRSSFAPNGIRVSPDGQSVIIHNKQFADAVTQSLKD
ncbi:MAG: nucleoid-associated protein [Methylotenera sp.]|nr:nucleoid-associated protein [Methylotenera sp.]MDD4927425.1 nucleoid-associated protein [Methylotenera sp.]